MTRKRLLLLALAAAALPIATAASSDVVDFTIVERIHFSVPGDWTVIANRSTSEKTVFAFQIPNPADDGTSESSNLSLIAADLKTPQDKDAFEKQPSSAAAKEQERSLVQGWSCGTFSAVQDSTRTQYVIWDCRRAIADCGVSVRIAWPHLPKNPPGYDEQMEQVLSRFLTSVGPYTGIPKSGVLRRQID